MNYNFIETPELLLPILIGLLIIFLFAFLGTKRGILSLGATFTSIILAALAAEPLGVYLLPLASYASIPLLLHTLSTTLTAGILVFVISRICFEILLHLFSSPKHALEGWEFFSGFGGAILGGCEGALVVFILAWALTTLSDFINLLDGTTQLSPEASTTLSIRESPFSGSLIPTKLIKKSAEVLRDSPIGSLTEKTPLIPEEVDTMIEGAQSIIEDPSKIEEILNMEGVTTLIEHPTIQNVIADEEIQTLIHDNDFGALLTNEKVNALLNDTDVVEMMKEIDIDALRAILKK